MRALLGIFVFSCTLAGVAVWIRNGGRDFLLLYILYFGGLLLGIVIVKTGRGLPKTLSNSLSKSLYKAKMFEVIRDLIDGITEFPLIRIFSVVFFVGTFVTPEEEIAVKILSFVACIGTASVYIVALAFRGGQE